MGRRRAGLFLILALLSADVAADQGPPVYAATGTQPVAGGACAGPRVQVGATTGSTWCCVASVWVSCGAAAGSSPGGVSGNLQTNNGSGGFGAYAATACGGSQYVTGVSASGALTCATATASVPDATASVTGGVRLTGDLGGTATSPTVPGLAGKAASSHTHGGSDVTSAVANATAATTAAGVSGTTGTPSSSTFLRGDWSWQAPPAQDWAVITGKPSTFPATTPVATASALAANGSNCTSGQAALGVDAAGAAEGCWTVQQPASTTALKAGTVGGAFADYAGSTCSAGQAPLGLTAAGAVSGCFTPAGTYTLPAASTTLGGTKMAAACGAGNHVSSIGAGGELTCSADSGGGAPTTSTYWTATSEAGLSAEVNLGALTTGLLKHTVTAGTSAPATASAGTDYGPPTSGNATGLVISTTTTGAHTAYGGTSCTNQFPRSLSAVGAATCASVVDGDFSGTLTQGKGGTGAGALTCSAGQHLTSNGTAYSCTADTAYTLPAATATVLGGVKGTGTGTACTGGQYSTGHDAAGALQCGTPAGSYTLPDATNLVTGGVRLTGQLGGTATSPTVTGVTGAVVGVANINATGTPGSGNFLRGDGTWNPASGSGAPTTAGYWTTVADAGLSAEVVMGALGTGLVVNTTTTGVPTIYAGSSCTNQFARSTNASGTLACAGVGVADFTANQGTIWQSLHGNAAGQPTWGISSAHTLTTATWASSATANTLGIVGTGATPLTSPVYAAVARSRSGVSSQ